MKHGVTSRTAIKFGAVALVSFVVGRLSTLLVTWPHTPKWMDVDATGVVVNGVVAIGTCAAVIVALALAVRQNQQKMRDELNRAKLTAVGATFRLGAAQGYVINAIEEFKSESKSRSNLSTDSLIKIAHTLKGSDIFDWTEIHNLAPLPGNPAVFIACARDRIHLVIAAIASAVNTADIEPTTAEDADNAIAALEDAERWLAKAIAICETQTEGFAPPDGSIELVFKSPKTEK